MTTPMRDRIELKVSPEIALIHDPHHHKGKTSGMDKGMFLAVRGVPCAGESAGLGLPVLVVQGRTFFPSLSSAEPIGPTLIEKTFRMDRVLVWHLGKNRAPEWFGRAAERIAEIYAKSFSLQRGLLGLRGAVFSLLRIRSGMVRGEDRGCCVSRYEVGNGEVRVCIDASSLRGGGMLTVLNEGDGRSFTRLRIGKMLFEGSGIPAWRKTTFDAVFESPSLGLGMSLSPGRREESARYTLFCGREVGTGLDWAGLAVAYPRPAFFYHVRFHPNPGRVNT